VKARYLKLISSGSSDELSLETLARLSDEALIAEFQSGRDAAFEVLYRRYRTRILNYLHGMIANPALADEIYNELMFRVYSRLPDTLVSGQFQRYLYRAAHNACLNTRRRELFLDRQPPKGTSWGGAAHSTVEASTPEERLSSGQLLGMARSFLESLPEERRGALLLYHYDGMSYQEIAEVLGKPVGTVRWLIHEARAAMARYLSEHVSVGEAK
jgi:RNA polymerase sigma-70 factor (ECF subfamily)